MKLRVGVVGLGPHWESRYRPALRALSDRFEVRAVYDPVGHRAQQAAREFEARAVEGLRTLLHRPDVDAVLILASQWIGPLPVTAAADAGKAVYCAPHLDLSLEDTFRLRDRVNSAGIVFMAELPRRNAPATIRLKELMATKLGRPNLLFAHLRHTSEKKPQQRGGHWHPPQLETSLADLIEQVDWCRYVVGHEPTSVLGLLHESIGGPPSVEPPYPASTTAPQPLVGEVPPSAFAATPPRADYQMMSLDFSGAGLHGTGAVAQISSGKYVAENWEEAVTFRPPANLQVSCERGIAFIDLPSKVVWFDDAGRHQESLDSERPLGELLLLRFYRSVTSLVRGASSLDETCRALEIVLKSRQSHREGRRVPL